MSFALLYHHTGRTRTQALDLPQFAMSLPKPKGNFPCWTPIMAPSSFFSGPQVVRASTADAFRMSGDRLDLSQTLTLESIRDSLIRQEDSIIFNLLERAQYCFNAPTYDAGEFSFPGFRGSLVEFMLKETEILHAKVGRYKSPDEHSFFPSDLPEPLLPPLHYPQLLILT